MSPRLIVLFLFVTIAFGACEKKDTIYSKKINNTSSKAISFYFFGNFNPTTYGDTVYVAAGELKEIFTYTEENSNVGILQPCVVSNDSIQVAISGGGTLTVDLRNENDWVATKDSENRQTCTFEITDADIL